MRMITNMIIIDYLSEGFGVLLGGVSECGVGWCVSECVVVWCECCAVVWCFLHERCVARSSASCKSTETDSSGQQSCVVGHAHLQSVPGRRGCCFHTPKCSGRLAHDIAYKTRQQKPATTAKPQGRSSCNHISHLKELNVVPRQAKPATFGVYTAASLDEPLTAWGVYQTGALQVLPKPAHAADYSCQHNELPAAHDWRIP